MRIASGYERSRNGDRVVHGRALADAPIVDVAAEIAGRNGVDDISFLRRQADDPEMRPDGNLDVLEDAVVLLDGAVVDRDPRIVDGLVHHAERIRLRRPLKIVDRL